MPDTREEGISTLVKMEDIGLPDGYGSVDMSVTVECEPLYLDSTSIAEFKPGAGTMITIEGESNFSYTMRRPGFMTLLETLSKQYPDTMYIQVQQEVVDPYPMAMFMDNDVLFFDNNYSPIQTPTLSDIVDSPERHDIAIFDDEHARNGQALQDMACQYNVRWSSYGDEIWLEITRLDDPTGERMGETYFHAIFDESLASCHHVDAHYFKFEQDAYQEKLDGARRADLKEIIKDGKPQKSKFTHFKAFNELNASDALVMAREFFHDPRLDAYLNPLIQELGRQ
ncbi:MAG: hypothetical protein KJ709_05085 [Nanoarchaeota archaeon]|nr:hypothetical protein [Nanoarchaeota archaeon]